MALQNSHLSQAGGFQTIAICKTSLILSFEFWQKLDCFHTEIYLFFCPVLLTLIFSSWLFLVSAMKRIPSRALYISGQRWPGLHLDPWARGWEERIICLSKKWFSQEEARSHSAGKINTFWVGSALTLSLEFPWILQLPLRLNDVPPLILKNNLY